MKNFFQKYNSPWPTSHMWHLANVSHGDFAFRNYLQTTVHSRVSARR